MKNRVLTFVIGALTGAIIATTGFYFYARSVSTNRNIPLNEPMPTNGEFRGRGEMQGSMPFERGQNNNMSSENN